MLLQSNTLGSVLCCLFVTVCLARDWNFPKEDADQNDQSVVKDENKPTATEQKSEIRTCKKFATYVVNCMLEATEMYNSTMKSPPPTYQMEDWCRSIKHLENCGSSWNTMCQHETEELFHEESLKGYQHVVSNICDDKSFLEKYKWNSHCIPAIAKDWERCYMDFKEKIDAWKNISQSWTHFETHFFLCCAKAEFRRCTYEILMRACGELEVIVLQKYSVILSEGEVYQNCEHGVVYEKCPGGDPRPTRDMLLLPARNCAERL